MTLFEAAFLSRPVFATIVLRLAERGKLDLDRPLHELLPYERISHDPRSRRLTARLVLSHQTGLPNWGPPEKLEFRFEPGESFIRVGVPARRQEPADVRVKREFLTDFAGEAFLR